MLLELERDERELLVKLVQVRIDELAHEVAGPQTASFADRCGGEKRVAERLMRHLHESEWDVTC
jgi:hypothetical protein